MRFSFTTILWTSLAILPYSGFAEENPSDQFIGEMLNLPGLENDEGQTHKPEENVVPLTPVPTPPSSPSPVVKEPLPSPPAPVEEKKPTIPPTEAEKAADLGQESEEKKPVPVPQKTVSPTQASTQPLFSGKTGDVFWSGSIMYNPSDYRKLRQAIAIFERLNQGTSLSSTYTSGALSTIQAKAPAFALNSIVYFSKDNWTFWLNDKKYTVGAPPKTDVEVVDVNRDRIHLMWRPGQPLSQISPGWQDKLVVSESGDYISNDRDIWIDNAGNEIHFFLQPNQTFETSAMEIIEGIRRPADYSSIPQFDEN